MKKLFLVLFFLISTSVFAKTEFKFGGYIFEMPIVQGVPKIAEDLDYSMNDKTIFTNFTRFRFTPELLIGTNGIFTLNYQLDAILSKINLLNSNTNTTNRQAVNLNWTLFNENNIKINHFIDRLYYKQIFDWGDVVLGRQNLAFGVGKIWQPTDLFNPINPANFSKFEKDGVDGIAAAVHLGNFSDIKFVYNTYNAGKKGNYTIKFNTHDQEINYSAMAGYFDSNPVIGCDLETKLFGIGFRGEGLYYYQTNIPDSCYFRGILGADYYFNNKFYALIEYQYNGQGTNCKYCYVNLLPKLLKGEIQDLGTYYLAEKLVYHANSSAEVSALNITNLMDRSGFINLSFEYKATEKLNLTFAGAYFYGAYRTEYDYYYSDAAYLLALWYF